MVGQSNFNVRNVLAHCDPAFVEDQTLRFRRLAAHMDRVQNGLLYGDTALELRPLLKVSASHFHLFMQDGCVANGLRYYDVPACQATFYDGLVGKGLQGAYTEYLQLARKTVEDRYLATRPGVPCQPEALNGGVAELLEDLAEKYLAAGFKTAASITVTSVGDYLDSFRALNFLATACSLVALFIFFFAVYTPKIRRMDAEIKHVRHLLLLFPDEVSRAVPAIIAAGRELLKDSGVGSESGSVVSDSGGAARTKEASGTGGGASG
jgi:hypothetical protein